MKTHQRLNAETSGALSRKSLRSAYDSHVGDPFCAAVLGCRALRRNGLDGDEAVSPGFRDFDWRHGPALSSMSAQRRIPEAKRERVSGTAKHPPLCVSGITVSPTSGVPAAPRPRQRISPC